MSKLRKLIYTGLIMFIYIILLFINISPKISFKKDVNGISPEERVYIYSSENIRILRVDDKSTGLITPNLIEVAAGTHELKVEYKKGKIKKEHYFEPYNYPAGRKVIVVGETRGNEILFDLKLGELPIGNISILEYIFYIASTGIAFILCYMLIKEIKTLVFYEKKLDAGRGALLKTSDNLYIEKIYGKKVNVKSMKVSAGEYILDIIYMKNGKYQLFNRKRIIFSDVQVDIENGDVLLISYVIENKKIRLDFKLNQE